MFEFHTNLVIYLVSVSVVMRYGRGSIFISIMVLGLMIQIIPDSNGMEWDETYQRSDAKPWKIWYRDPENIQSMEMDQENRTLYIGCEYGLVIKDLDTEEFNIIDRFDGVNSLADQQVIDIELDLANERVFFALEKGPEVYELDIISETISKIHKFDDGSNLFKWGDSRALEYDPISDVLFFARDSGLLVFNMRENHFRFLDFLHFGVELYSYTVSDNEVEVVMAGYNGLWKNGPGDMDDNSFQIKDLELCLSRDRLFIATNNGLFSYDMTKGIIEQDISTQKLGRFLKDILFIPDLDLLFLAGEKVWSFNPNTNSTGVIYEDYLDRDQKHKVFLKLLWNVRDQSLIISSGLGPALIFLDWDTGAVTFSNTDIMIVENVEFHHLGWDLSAGNYTEMVLDGSTFDLLLSRGDIIAGGYWWNVTYDVDVSVPVERYWNRSNFLEINGYDLIIDIDVKGKGSKETHGRRDFCGSLFQFDLDGCSIRSRTILDYFTHDDEIYRIHMSEPRNHIASKGNRLFAKLDSKGLWDLNIEEGTLSQEYFPYFNETYEKYRYRNIRNIFTVGDDIHVSLAGNGTILYDIENGTRKFDVDLQIGYSSFQIGPVSGHIFTGGNRTGNIIEYDPMTGESIDHYFNISDPNTGQPGYIEHLVFNTDETIAVIGGIRNITTMNMKYGVLGNKNYLEDIETWDPRYQFDEFITEIIYHEGTDTFYGFTNHGEIIDILRSKRLGYLTNSTVSDYCLGPNGSKILAVTGKTMMGSIGFDADEPNGLISYDPSTGEIEDYNFDIGLPWVHCLGLTVNEESGWICIIGKTYIAVIREEDLVQVDKKNGSDVTEDVPVNHPEIEENSGAFTDELIFGAAGLCIISLLGAAIIFFEPLKFKILSAFAYPLFTKVRGKDLLGNKKRRKIIGVIREHPYIHFNGIRKELSLGPGEAAYHLRVLEREEMIGSEPRGVRKVFYLIGGKKKGNEFLQSRLQRMIVDLISMEPGISQRELSRRLDTNPSTINYNVRSLARRDIIRIERSSSRSMCYRTN